MTYTTEQAVADLYALASTHKIRAYQIAQEAGITRVTLSNWKSKRSEPTLSAFLAAKNALERLIKAKSGS